MVGYTHESTTFWRIWEPDIHMVRSQSEVIFDKEQNACILCTTPGIDIFGLPSAYIEELLTGAGFLQAQNAAIGSGGDGLLHRLCKDISGTGEGNRGGDHGHINDVIDDLGHMPDDSTHRSLPARAGSRSYPPDEGRYNHSHKQS